MRLLRICRLRIDRLSIRRSHEQWTDERGHLLAVITATWHLGLELEATVAGDHAASGPGRVRARQHPDHCGNFFPVRRSATTHLLHGQLDQRRIIHSLSHSRQRAVQLEGLHLLPEFLARRIIHVSFDGARVDCIHGRALSKLAGPGAGHRLQGRLGATVEGVCGEAHAGSHATDVDDASGPLVREVWQRRLGDQDRGKNVHGVDSVELRHGDLTQRIVTSNASVVDKNIDRQLAVLGEVFLGRRDDRLCGLCAQIRLDAVGLDAILLEL